MGMFVRRGKAMEMLGMGKKAFAKVMKSGKLKPRYLMPRSRALFVVTEIEQLSKGVKHG